MGQILLAMKLSVLALSLSIFASVFAMEPKAFRKSTQVTEDMPADEGALVLVQDDNALVTVQDNQREGLQMIPAYNYANGITILSPEARARFVAFYTSTGEICYYFGSQLYCIAQVGLTMANQFLSAADNALDKAEEIEGGVRQTIDKAEVTVDRYQKVRNEFQHDVERAGTLLENKKPSDEKPEENV